MNDIFVTKEYLEKIHACRGACRLCTRRFPNGVEMEKMLVELRKAGKRRREWIGWLAGHAVGVSEAWRGARIAESDDPSFWSEVAAAHAPGVSEEWRKAMRQCARKYKKLGM